MSVEGERTTQHLGAAEVRDAVLALTVAPAASIAGALFRFVEASADIAAAVIERTPLRESVLSLQERWNEQVDEVAGRTTAQLALGRFLDNFDPIPVLIERIDINQLIAERVDIQAVIDRVDLIAVAREVIAGVDLPAIVRDSSQTMASETIEGLRRQGMNADRTLSELIDKFLRRKSGRQGSSLGTPEIGQTT